MPHPNDLPQDDLDRALACAERPDLLLLLVETSRRAFGLHTRHYPHTINYPWTASRLEALPGGSRLLEIGAGINPLPLYLAEKGMHVDCVDSSDFTRTLPADGDWNEWGFFDYATLHPNLAAHNCSIADFQPSHSYDSIYSVGSIAHMPTPVRETCLRNCRAWLKPGGILVLAIDLIPGTDTLWNLGGSEETPEQHGTFHDMQNQLRSLGFDFGAPRIDRNVRKSRTDLYFLEARV